MMWISTVFTRSWLLWAGAYLATVTFLGCLGSIPNTPPAAPAPKTLSHPEISLLTPPPDRIPELSSQQILKDPEQRISADFRVPAKFAPRVGFWFDIYARYGTEDHVIHHVRYPWLIFEVVNTSAIDTLRISGWRKAQKKQQLVKNTKLKIKKALLALSKQKVPQPQTATEKKWLTLIKKLPGNLRNNTRLAANHLRSQLGQRDFILKGIRESGRYLPWIEGELARNGLPTEISTLPFVESSFNVKAYSSKGAAGIWQIMPSIGRAYGTVNSHLDERRSPFKSTRMAMRLLKQNYRILGDWPLTLTSYNHGVGNLKKSLRASQSDNLFEMIERYHDGEFQFASANFYACFLAILHLERYISEYHGTVFKREEFVPLEMIQVRQPVTPEQLAKNAKLSLAQLIFYNLDLTRAAQTQRKLPMNYRVFLPIENKETLARSHGQRIKGES